MKTKTEVIIDWREWRDWYPDEPSGAIMKLQQLLEPHGVKLTKLPDDHCDYIRFQAESDANG